MILLVNLSIYKKKTYNLFFHVNIKLYTFEKLLTLLSFLYLERKFED